MSNESIGFSCARGSTNAGFQLGIQVGGRVEGEGSLDGGRVDSTRLTGFLVGGGVGTTCSTSTVEPSDSFTGLSATQF